MVPAAVNPPSRSTPPLTFIPSATRASPWLSVPVSWAPRQLSWPVMSVWGSRTAPAAVNPSSRTTAPLTFIPSATRASPWLSVPVSWAPRQTSWPVMSVWGSRTAPAAVNPSSRNTPPLTFIPSATSALPSLSVPVSWAPRQTSWPVMSAPDSRTAPAAVNPSSRNTPPLTFIPSATSALPSLSVPVSWAPRQPSRPVMSARGTRSEAFRVERLRSSALAVSISPVKPASWHPVKVRREAVA